MSELALRLEVDPKILYYPLKKLTDAGLVWRTGSTKSNRRIEGMYGLVAYRMELPKSAALETRKKLMRTTIRCAEQDATNAQEASIVDPKVTDAMNVFRAPLWLSEDDRKELFQELSGLVEKYSSRSIRQENDLLMWTSLIVPVARRN